MEYLDRKDRIKVERNLRLIKAKDKALDKLMGEFFYDKMMDEPATICEEFLHHKDEFLKWSAKRSGVDRYKYAMFTINFKVDDLQKIKPKVEKCLKKVWIEKYLYCYEQRGVFGVNLGEGVHVHLKVWIKKGKNIYRGRGEVFNTFKHLVGNKKHVNVIYSNFEGCFEDYIKGYKKNKSSKVIERKSKYSDDVSWREREGLENFYVGENIKET